ncbi:MAG: DNA polymerase IV [Lachnospiraceae bacterium]|nr:DNA polymerase IV [Lachnospiraceae bacterium]
MSDTLFFHIDVNSAFLSWSALSLLEQGQSTDIRTIPSIIGGDISKRHGVVLAKSIPAKAYGITTGEPVVNAFRKCPTLVSVPPDHRLYAERSQILMSYLASICPELEQVSIDECYLNFTPIAGEYASPEEAAHIIKDEVHRRFGFTVNVGISNRKVLAKMASDFQKPDRVHTLYSHEIKEKLWPLPISSLFLCGRSSVNILHNLGILTIGDLAASEPAIIEGHLKSHGRTLWNYANGIDDSVVVPEPAQAKGIGHSTTVAHDITEYEEACRILLQLSEAVSKRLREQSFCAGQVCTEIKYSTFKSVSHQGLLITPSASTEVIYRKACELFRDLWDESPVRLLGIRVTKFTPASEPVQLSLFDYSAPVNEKHQKLDRALDSIRQKYGRDAVLRGSLYQSTPRDTLSSAEATDHSPSNE